jgi:UDP-galactose transporter B1
MSTKELSQEIKLLIAVLGIYSCYIAYGLCQEALYEYKSPTTGAKFTSTFFFLFVQCSVNAIFSGIAMLFFGSSGNKPPTTDYMKLGFSYICAMLFSNEALKYVSYPTQALAKSCKMIPVMLFGFLIRNKRYSLKETIAVLLITSGIHIFQSGKTGGESSVYGLVLLFLSLVLDGVTGATQDLVQETYRLSTHDLMFHTNLWAVALLTVLISTTGQAQTGILYCMENKDIIKYILAASLTSAAGQNFIFYTISNFNSLVLATITTTRKFFTILVSVFSFGHILTNTQWAGVSLVFTGLTLELHSKYILNKNKHKKKEHDKKS